MGIDHTYRYQTANAPSALYQNPQGLQNLDTGSQEPSIDELLPSEIQHIISPPLSPFFVGELIKTTTAGQKLVVKIVQSTIKAARQEMGRLKRIVREANGCTFSAEEKKDAVNRWKTCIEVIEYVSASFSLMCGLALAISGENEAVYGYAMVGAAAIGGAAKVASYTGAFDSAAKLLTDDPEKQRQLATGMHTGLSLVSSLGSLAAGYAAGQEALRLGLRELPEAITGFCLAFTNIARGTGEVGKFAAEQDRIKEILHLTRLEVEKTISDANTKTLTGIIKKQADAQSIWNRNLLTIIQEFERLMQKTRIH